MEQRGFPALRFARWELGRGGRQRPAVVPAAQPPARLATVRRGERKSRREQRGGGAAQCLAVL